MANKNLFIENGSECRRQNFTGRVPLIVSQRRRLNAIDRSVSDRFLTRCSFSRRLIRLSKSSQSRQSFLQTLNRQQYKRPCSRHAASNFNEMNVRILSFHEHWTLNINGIEWIISKCYFLLRRWFSIGNLFSIFEKDKIWLQTWMVKYKEAKIKGKKMF